MKAALILFLFLYSLFLIPHSTYAAESSPSADIKAKVEELKKQIASKAAALKQQIDKKLQNKAYVGKVLHPASGGKTKSQSSLTLATLSGPKIVSINQDTEFESNIPKKKFSQSTLSEEDYVASLGDVDETGVLTAKKIILLPPPADPKILLWGQIIALDKLATLKDKSLKNIAVSLPETKVKVNDFVILTGKLGKNEIFDAEFVYVIPQGGILKTKKVATPSSKNAN